MDPSIVPPRRVQVNRRKDSDISFILTEVNHWDVFLGLSNHPPSLAPTICHCRMGRNPERRTSKNLNPPPRIRSDWIVGMICACWREVASICGLCGEWLEITTEHEYIRWRMD